MGRWEPDARGRLARAALDLYAERGYEQTTVADIAQRAGVTERTFFRHFTDKREVLFDPSLTLQETMVAAIAAAPADRTPVETVVGALQTAVAMLEERRDWSRRRAAVIAANPSLLERELLKLAALATAAGAALRARGVREPRASLAAETGVTAFKVGFEHWVGEPPAQDEAVQEPESPARTLADHIGEALDEIRALTATPRPLG
ncbi:MAG: TetR family transcriptional regulator [Hamadaea sp.]|uniref:TetR/AcrR family transcriptional regulator n=1 Tax=Hamadaea sp. TaxID=2024425 RepID=UPI0017EB2C2C|nr:helix-turn-helix domain-containing protein [Hamadaea sp.]NUR73175.1 TetR family transcriptional regulator [Hamadaea sp.]NUT18459.1 TetR family transcriptional regulator [Hamadaea sp.]